MAEDNKNSNKEKEGSSSQKEFNNKTLLVLAVISLTLAVLFNNFLLTYYNHSFQREKALEEGVLTEVGLTDAKDMYEDTYYYLNNDVFSLDTGPISFLTEEEQSHMKDVKVVITSLKFLYYASLLFLLSLFTSLFFYNKKNFKGKLFYQKTFTYSGIAILVLSLVFSILVLLAFPLFWDYFHKILFPQGNWLFSSDSTLIKLFPLGFFQSLAVRVLNLSIFGGIISVTTGWLLKRS